MQISNITLHYNIKFNVIYELWFFQLCVVRRWECLLRKMFIKYILKIEECCKKKSVLWRKTLHKGMGSSGSTAEPTVKGSELPINAVYV